MNTTRPASSLRRFRQGEVVAVVVADDGTVLSHHRSLRCAERTVRAAVASWHRGNVDPGFRVVCRDDEAWAAVAAEHPEWDGEGR